MAMQSGLMINVDSNAKYIALERKYSILIAENKEYRLQIDDLQRQKDSLLREVATYQMEEEYCYTPAMSMGISSNASHRLNGCDQIRALQSEVTALKEMNQRLTVALDASNKQSETLKEKCDDLMNKHSEKVQSMEKTINFLENELNILKNGILFDTDDSHATGSDVDNESVSNESLSRLHVNYEDRLRQLEIENTKLIRRLDLVRNDECGIKGNSLCVSCVDEFEDISLNGDDITDDFEESELNDLELLFQNCAAEVAQSEMCKRDRHWKGNMYRFLMFKPYKY